MPAFTGNSISFCRYSSRRPSPISTLDLRPRSCLTSSSAVSLMPNLQLAQSHSDCSAPVRLEVRLAVGQVDLLDALLRLGDQVLGQVVPADLA